MRGVKAKMTKSRLSFTPCGYSVQMTGEGADPKLRLLCGFAEKARGVCILYNSVL